MHTSPCCEERLKLMTCPDCSGVGCYSCDNKGKIEEMFECTECGEQFSVDEMAVIVSVEEREQSYD